MDDDFVREFYFRCAAQRFPQNVFFDFELLLVGYVLIVTSAALAEIRTTRLDTVGRRLDDRVDLRSRESGLLSGERSLYCFAANYEGDEDGFAAAVILGGLAGWGVIRRKASQAVAAVEQFFNGKEQQPILSHRVTALFPPPRPKPMPTGS